LQIEISKIKIGERIRKDSGDIDELAASISKEGLLCPIIVRQLDDGYKLLAGWRRLQAYNVLKHTFIESIIKK